ncbi:hypothetical protein QBC43DRAFT_289504 [Cladorrhinum sp. PSN259]|nr:hypothetical protein QBC43DRAFT_289504 [Cladorrhinum sp. PSN259]
MQTNLPGPRETIVSAVHGNTGCSDNASPVAVYHYAQGVVITPPPSPSSSSKPSVKDAVRVGKIHFTLPTLRAAEENTTNGTLTGRAMVSTSLEIQAAPYAHPGTSLDVSGPGRGKGKGQGQADITAVELYSGRDSLGSWGGGAPKEKESWQSTPLPAHDDFRIHLGTNIHGSSQDGLADNPGGLGVTLTVEFRGGEAALMISSVALVRTVRGRG